jgi:hypothetical protein
MAFNMNHGNMSMPQQPQAASGFEEQLSSNSQMSALRRSTFEHVDASQPWPGVSPDPGSCFSDNNNGLHKEAASTLDPSYHLNPIVTTPQELNFNASNLYFNESRDSGLRNTISGHGVSFLLSLRPLKRSIIDDYFLN